MVNGYVFLDLTKSNVYTEALKALGADKPVVIKDGQGSPYFVDSLTLSGTNVVITKGGKTITIANDNTITNEGDIQEKLYTYYFDTNDGNVASGNITTNHYLSFISNIKNLNDLEISEFNKLKVIAINSQYESDGDLLNILAFEIRYNSSDEKLHIISYQDGIDDNILDIEFTINPIISIF